MRERIAIGAAVAVAVATGAVSYAHDHSVPYAAGAFVAGALAVAIAWFASTLPGLTVRGLVIGGLFVLAGMLSWTSLGYGRWLVWPLLGLEGIVFAVWAWPWLRHLRALPRLGSAWLGLAYWVLGVVGALLVVNLAVAAQRVAYAGVFGLAVLAVVASARRDRGRDLSVGIVGAFLLAVALLVVSGSGNLFQHRHVVPPGGWGTEVMVHRFWGGPWLLYHPNSLALIAVVAAMRIGVDRAFTCCGAAGAPISRRTGRSGSRRRCPSRSWRWCWCSRPASCFRRGTGATMSPAAGSTPGSRSAGTGWTATSPRSSSATPGPPAPWSYAPPTSCN